MDEHTPIPTFYSYVDELGPREAARRLGVAHSSVSRALSGQTAPTQLLLAALAEWPDINLEVTKAETARRRAEYSARRAGVRA